VPDPNDVREWQQRRADEARGSAAQRGPRARLATNPPTDPKPNYHPVKEPADDTEPEPDDVLRMPRSVLLAKAALGLAVAVAIVHGSVPACDPTGRLAPAPTHSTTAPASPGTTPTPTRKETR
jgi:hypothetical protein